MKISKLIIPFLGFTSINNANNQANAIKIENLPEISYEVSVKDNWDNYLTTENLKKNEFIQLNTQSFLPESSGDLIIPIIKYEEGCYVLYLAAVSACQALWFFNPGEYGYCMRQAWRAYMACKHGYVN